MTSGEVLARGRVRQDRALPRRLAAAARWRPLPLAVLLAVTGLLLTVWTFSVPLGEGPDEPDHIAYAHYLQVHRALPPYDARYVEANEPPLYYALIAPLVNRDFTVPADMRLDIAGHPQPLHPPAQWKHTANELGAYPGLYLARLLTAAFGLLTVTFTYLAGLELAGRRTEALLAAAMVALLPEFSFRGMNISCDALVLTICAATTWAVVRISRRGFSWRRGLGAAALLGLACLAKVTALALLPALALAILLQPRLPIRRRVRHLLVLAVVPLLLAPYLVRNQLLYGDPFAAAALARAVPGAIVHKSLLSGYFALPFPTLVVQSFLARFGWMNLAVPAPVLTLLLIPGLCGAAALPLALRSSEQRTLLLSLLTAPVASVIALVGFNLTVSQAQGRYLFPALPAMALAAVLLYRQIPGWVRAPRLLVPALVGGYALLNLGIVLTVVRPAYGG